METPVPSKTPRRKLKRIKGKNKLSHKKLRTAINVSLNTSHNVRTLRINNRSLAHRLEGLKKEYRAAFDAYQGIQEENHYLRQKVVSLECIINEPDSYIEEQVNIKFEARVREFKNVIQRLHTNVEGLSGDLKTLDTMCLSDSSPTTIVNQRSYSMDGILSRVPPSLLSPSSLRFQSDLTIGSLGESNTRMEDVMNQASESLNLSNVEASSGANGSPASDSPEGEKLKDMSMILEQSVIFGVKSPLKNIERNLQPEKETMNSKLPRRVLARSRERRGEEPDVERTESSVKTMRKSRRATRILSDDEVNVLGILDIEPPSDLLFSPKLPSSSGDNDDQRKDVDEPLSGDDKFKEAPVTTRPGSNVQVKKKSNMKLHKQMNNIQREATVKHGKGNDGLFISNEFALINAHEQITKKLQTADKTASEETGCTDVGDDEDHTVHIVEDMDLTMPINVDISVINGFENHLSNMKKEISDVESESSEPPNFEEFCPEAVTLQRMRPGQFKFAASRKETDGSRKCLLSQPPRARSKSKKAIAQMIENLPQEEPKSIFDFHDKTPTQISEKEKDMSVYSLRDESSIISPPTPLGRAKSKSRMLGEESSESISQSGQEGSVKGNNQGFLKTDVECNNEVAFDSLKSQSRRKNHGERSHTNETLSNDSRGSNKDSEVSSVLGEGLTYNVPLKDVSDTIEKVATRKSRGRSRNRTKSSAQDAVIVSNEEESSLIHTEKSSTLDDGMTYSIPVKDDSSFTEKVTVRNSRSKSRGRGSRARSQSRAKSSANREQDADSEETVGSMNKLNLQSQKSSKLDEGMVTQAVPPKDNAVDAIPLRKPRRQSQERKETSICQKNLIVSQEIFCNQTDTLPKETVLGEGITYSVPIKDSDEAEKVTVRKSRGRSRTRENEKISHSSETANSYHRTRSRSRHRQIVPNEDESGETVSQDIQRKSRGRSRTRDKDKGSENREKSQANIEVENISGNEKMNATEICQERHAGNSQQEKVTDKKVIEQLQEGNGNSVPKQPSIDSYDLINEGHSNTHLKETSVLGDGITYSVPIKDYSDEAEKVTVKRSRGRSRTRGIEEAAQNSGENNPHYRVRSRSRRRKNVENEDGPCENVSHREQRKSLGRSRTRENLKRSEKPENFQTDGEGERIPDHENMKTKELCQEGHKNLHQQETISVKKSKEQSQEENQSSICKQPFDASQEVSNNQAISDILPKEMSVLKGGTTYSVLVKDGSDESEKVTVKKSRGRSRTRGTEEAAHKSEADNSHDRARSRSRRRQNVEKEDEPCENISHSEPRKSPGQSRQKEKLKRSEKPEKSQTDKTGEGLMDDGKMRATDFSKERHDKNLHQKRTTKLKLNTQIADNVVQDAQSEEKSKTSDEDIFIVDTGLTQIESHKRKSPSKTIKNRVPKSSKKMKKCEVKSTTSPSSQECSKSPVRNSCTDPSSQQPSEIETLQRDHNGIESSSSITSPQVKSSVKVDGIRANKAESNERSMEGLIESSADSYQVKTFVSLKRNKKGREQDARHGKIVCEDQETFQMQMERLKNLYTPESFKTAKESQSLSSSSQSLSDFSEGKSAKKETDLEEPSCEPMKRRRAASKCANYAEPSLGAKLRRGDPFTSGPGNVPMYKSPKAMKKIKVKRDILGPLQNHLVKEEAS